MTPFTGAIGAALKIIPACILNCVITGPLTLPLPTVLKRVEAGAQGSHKLARGYLPVTTHSLHWFRDAGFAAAVEDYLRAERAAVDEEIEVLTSYGPFRKTDIKEQE